MLDHEIDDDLPRWEWTPTDITKDPEEGSNGYYTLRQVDAFLRYIRSGLTQMESASRAGIPSSRISEFIDEGRRGNAKHVRLAAGYDKHRSTLKLQALEQVHNMMYGAEKDDIRLRAAQELLKRYPAETVVETPNRPTRTVIIVEDDDGNEDT